MGKGNPYEVEPGWGVIGTHVSPPAARRGVGTALFAASRREAMGFRTYRTSARATGKRYEVGGPA